ncbi:MAG TPA: DUF1439 domain-containing protein [Campylobacterales bacterium]|nr:DUF1439 domain-containing protein [Campylobacterales bacterium]
MKKLSIMIAFISTLLLTGCVQNISPNGLTVRIPASTVTSALEQQFPIKQSFAYGDVELSNPKALLTRGSNRVMTGTSIGFSNALFPMQRGSLYVSGIPYFDAQNGAVYLREPMIDKLEFNGYKLSSFLQGPLQNALIPIINEVFRNTPIYRVNRSSLQGSFVKNVVVDNGELLVTFGL